MPRRGLRVAMAAADKSMAASRSDWSKPRRTSACSASDSKQAESSGVEVLDGQVVALMRARFDIVNALAGYHGALVAAGDGSDALTNGVGAIRCHPLSL